MTIKHRHDGKFEFAELRERAALARGRDRKQAIKRIPGPTPQSHYDGDSGKSFNFSLLFTPMQHQCSSVPPIIQSLTVCLSVLPHFLSPINSPLPDLRHSRIGRAFE